MPNKKYVVFDITDTSFKSPEHFIESMKDLVTEWEDDIGPKELDEYDAGFNSQRLRELKEILYDKEV